MPLGLQWKLDPKFLVYCAFPNSCLFSEFFNQWAEKCLRRLVQICSEQSFVLIPVKLLIVSFPLSLAKNKTKQKHPLSSSPSDKWEAAAQRGVGWVNAPPQARAVPQASSRIWWVSHHIYDKVDHSLVAMRMYSRKDGTDPWFVSTRHELALDDAEHGNFKTACCSYWRYNSFCSQWWSEGSLQPFSYSCFTIWNYSVHSPCKLSSMNSRSFLVPFASACMVRMSWVRGLPFSPRNWNCNGSDSSIYARHESRNNVWCSSKTHGMIKHTLLLLLQRHSTRILLFG